MNEIFRYYSNGMYKLCYYNKNILLVIWCDQVVDILISMTIIDLKGYVISQMQLSIKNTIDIRNITKQFKYYIFQIRVDRIMIKMINFNFVTEGQHSTEKINGTFNGESKLTQKGDMWLIQGEITEKQNQPSSKCDDVSLVTFSHVMHR